MDNLSSRQRLAIEQLQELANPIDEEVCVSVLSSVEWDVQRAADLIFGSSSGGNASAPSSSTHEFEPMEVDDTEQGEVNGLLGSRGDRSTRPSQTLPLLRPIMSLLAFPLHILSGVFRFMFGILRIPLPQLRFSSLNFHRPMRPRPSARRGPDRWLRDLEEETGAISIGRLKLPRGTASAVQLEGGQSSISARGVSAGGLSNDDGKKILPDFATCSYEEFLKTCQRDAKIGCVILVSEEHDDTPEFKRSTLTDTAFVKLLYDNNILVWGGDVRDQEAWNASEKLQATTYPFVAFMALQPRRAPASSSRNLTPPILTVLSRHQGKSVPNSGPTSAASLIEHLQHQLLPRITPFLNRMTAVQRERERDRLLREEQDRAFQMSAMRDKERIEARMAEERAQLHAKRLAEEEARLASQRQAREAEIARQKESDRMDWRRWTRGALVFQPGTLNAPGSFRFAIRLPSGARVVHQFSSDATLTSLYAFVDTLFIPSQFLPLDDPVSLPDLAGVGEQALEAHITSLDNPMTYWTFQIVLAFPRVEIPWKAATKLSGIQQLRGGGQIVVEMSPQNRRKNEETSRPVNGDADDGYDTEDSE